MARNERAWTLKEEGCSARNIRRSNTRLSLSNARQRLTYLKEMGPSEGELTFTSP